MNANYTSTADVLEYVRQMKANTVLNNRNIINLRWQSPLDNHNPIREYGAGFALMYSNDHIENGLVLFHDDYFGKNRNIGFLVDDGDSVRPYYLASWNESGGFFILHPITAQNVSYYGPRKMYHLKVNQETWV